jgi:hypothetical protein
VVAVGDDEQVARHLVDRAAGPQVDEQVLEQTQAALAVLLRRTRCTTRAPGRGGSFLDEACLEEGQEGRVGGRVVARSLVLGDEVSSGGRP